ncbi:TPA: hypothetical protein ACG3H9_000239 [Clostridioides difficile]
MSRVNRYTTEMMIDEDIKLQDGKTRLFGGDNHRGHIKIGSSMYKYTRRLKDPFLVQDGENPYIYTLELVGPSLNI